MAQAQGRAVGPLACYVGFMRRPEDFVDEAGDSTLFNGRGVMIVGREGVSNTFIVGVADISDPVGAREKLDTLRATLLADPYFRNVPSMQASAGKTATCFHAKDDPPEVRREVFRVLPSLGVKVQAVIRRKADVAAEAKFGLAMGHRYGPSDLYDDLVKRLFKNLLHRGEAHTVCFARRGKGDRQEAPTAELERAKANFRKSWGTTHESPLVIRSSVPSQETGLQIIDYYLWALQRLVEKGEDRFFGLVADQFSLIMDLDDKRVRPYGRWYSVKDPLTIEKMKPLQG